MSNYPIREMRFLSCLAQLTVASCIALSAQTAAAQETSSPVTNVRLDLDQAEAALNLLEARHRGETITEEAWQHLFTTDGFIRVLEREAAIDKMLDLDRGYSEGSFREWAESDEALDDIDGRRRTLTNWTKIDVQLAGEKAMRYLPPDASLQATIYPIVRKQMNSFVWDLSGDPAIFLAVGDDVSAEEMANTLAHELHHVGLAGVCADKRSDEKDARLVAAQGWLSGFGEGLAVLAAAGGPSGATHARDQDELLIAWHNRVDSVEADMRTIESFLMGVRDGSIDEEEAQKRGMAFINSENIPQGPFYTLGWFMAVSVEKELGRASVIESTCDHRKLISNYQRSATVANTRDSSQVFPLWSEAFLEALQIAD
jgi:hypothetical protein